MKEDIKSFLFIDDTVFFVENLKDSVTKQNTPKTNESSKSAGYNMNTQKRKKSLIFLNTNNEYQFSSVQSLSCVRLFVTPS